MKKIIFPATSKIHLQRQQLLLAELKKYFEVDIWQAKEQKGGMAIASIFYAIEFNNYLIGKEFDFALIRADRYELLFLASVCAFREIPIIHIEGGADSGTRVVDTKVRDAISQLADIHLVTDEQAQKRVIFLGASPKTVFNVGSFDVSYAKSITPKQIEKEDYILCLFHSIPNEDEKVFYQVMIEIKLKHRIKVIGVRSNSDYQESITKEEYTPEDFISMLYYAKCVVGNSSCIVKETGILGTPSVLVGNRQGNRISGKNVLRVPFDKYEIEKAIEYQLSHKRYEPDYVYYQEDSEKKTCEILKNVI